MKTKIVILQTKVENQRQSIAGLENQLIDVRRALTDCQIELGEAGENIAWQKKRIASRDKKIKELQK